MNVRESIENSLTIPKQLKSIQVFSSISKFPSPSLLYIPESSSNAIKLDESLLMAHIIFLYQDNQHLKKQIQELEWQLKLAQSDIVKLTCTNTKNKQLQQCQQELIQHFLEMQQNKGEEKEDKNQGEDKRLLRQILSQIAKQEEKFNEMYQISTQTKDNTNQIINELSSIQKQRNTTQNFIKKLAEDRLQSASFTSQNRSQIIIQKNNSQLKHNNTMNSIKIRDSKELQNSPILKISSQILNGQSEQGKKKQQKYLIQSQSSITLKKNQQK